MEFDIWEFFGTGDETSPIMMLIWIVPVIIFVFYGQRIQLYITSSEIKKSIKKLDTFRTESRAHLIRYIQGSINPAQDPTRVIDGFLEHFTIMPVEMDPNGIVEKVKHVIRSREDRTRAHLDSLYPGIGDVELGKIQTLLEIASTLHMIHKVVNHMYLTAKKQNNYPLILPLQMLLPFTMEQARAMRDAIGSFEKTQPIGDGIGPMVVGGMMLGLKKEAIVFQTVLAQTEFEGRKLHLLKAQGPGSTVGRPADALEALIGRTSLDAIIMVDAALKLEGEDSATIAQGFGAAIGGIGTEKFQIEAVATKSGIPIFSVVVKQSVKEAITLMSLDISMQSDAVGSTIHDIIRQNTEPGQSILVIGVGNTVGVLQ